MSNVEIILSPEQAQRVIDGDVEELQQAVAKRLKKNAKPLPLRNPDFTELIDTCIFYIDGLDDGSIHPEDNDMEYYIYEAAIKAVFGPRVFRWINNKMS